MVNAKIERLIFGCSIFFCGYEPAIIEQPKLSENLVKPLFFKDNKGVSESQGLNPTIERDSVS